MAQLRSSGGLGVSQPHRCHHGRPFATAVLGAEEADITAGYQPLHGLVKTLGEMGVFPVDRAVDPDGGAQPLLALALLDALSTAASVPARRLAERVDTIWQVP